QREVLHLGDLLAVHLAEAAPEHREVLRVDADLAAVDRAVPGDDAVARDPLPVEPEVAAAVLGEGVELGERAFVKERLDALTGGLLAALVLLLAGRLLGDVDGGGPAGVEVVELRARAGEGRGGVVHTPSLVVGCLPLDA